MSSNVEGAVSDMDKAMEVIEKLAQGTPMGLRIQLTKCVRETVEAAVICTAVWYKKSDDIPEMVNTVLDKTKHHMSDKVMGLDVGNIDESVSAILINALLVARGFAEDECGVARTDGTEAGTFTDKSGD